MRRRRWAITHTHTCSPHEPLADHADHADHADPVEQPTPTQDEGRDGLISLVGEVASALGVDDETATRTMQAEPGLWSELERLGFHSLEGKERQRVLLTALFSFEASADARPAGKPFTLADFADALGVDKETVIAQLFIEASEDGPPPGCVWG